MNFPKDFLGFSQKPFNYPIQFQSGYSFINLLDYNYMINHYDDLEENNNSNQNDEDLHFKNIFVDIKEEEVFGYYCIAYCCRVCPSILMFMQNLSPTILIIDHSFFGFLMPTYFDKYGCIQLQYERNLPIFFNENSYEILIDKILSGDFSYDLLSFEEVVKGFRH